MQTGQKLTPYVELYAKMKLLCISFTALTMCPHMVFSEFVVNIHYNNYTSALIFSDTSLSSEWGCSVVLVSRFLNSVSPKDPLLRVKTSTH